LDGEIFQKELDFESVRENGTNNITLPEIPHDKLITGLDHGDNA